MSPFFSALRGHRAFKALHYREFRLVCGGQVFSNIGMWMDELSRGWLMYQLTDSVVQLGLVRGIQFVPTLLISPLAGTAAIENVFPPLPADTVLGGNARTRA